MADYGHIHVEFTRKQALAVLTEAAAALFGDRLRVRDAGFAIIVEAPGTAPTSAAEALHLWLAEGQDAGFAVEVERERLAFRHGPQPPWLSWVNECIEEEVCDRLGLPIVYDATDETRGPGERRARVAPTFRSYMTSLFGGALTAEDEAYLTPYFAITPSQFLDWKAQVA